MLSPLDKNCQMGSHFESYLVRYLFVKLRILFYEAQLDELLSARATDHILTLQAFL